MLRSETSTRLENGNVASLELFKTTSVAEKSNSIMSSATVGSGGEIVSVILPEGTYDFHSAWLHDAEMETGPSKNSIHSFFSKVETPRAMDATICGNGLDTWLTVTWSNGTATSYPSLWVRVYAPLVAQKRESGLPLEQTSPTGWLANDLKIPEFSYADIFPKDTSTQEYVALKEKIFEALLCGSASGIIKIVGLPPPALEDERNKENTLVTKVLKQLFRSVFIHPVRGADKTFNIATLGDDADRGIELSNYDTSQVLLPHSDHAHYTHPARVQGLYGLEGESVNTFVSCLAALRTLSEEHPNLVQHLSTAPMAVGRVAHFYTPTMYQGTVEPAITFRPGFASRIKRFRWHPHLAGFLLSPFKIFPEARAAYRALQEIIRRPTHQVLLSLAAGDMYIWDNFRIVHGRESVLKIPRTSIGQTVPEQVVEDRYRELLTLKAMKRVDEKWLIHMPLDCLCDLIKIIDEEDLAQNTINL